MKQFLRRGAALGLALAMTVTAASASQALGWDLPTLMKGLESPGPAVLCTGLPEVEQMKPSPLITCSGTKVVVLGCPSCMETPTCR